MDAAIRATQAIHMISPAEIQELKNDRHALFFYSRHLVECKKTTITTVNLVALEALGSIHFWVVRMVRAVRFGGA
jgi:hypothetical protein